MYKIRECKKFMKPCKECGKMFLMIKFKKQKTNKDGRINICYSCRYKKQNFKLICKECGKKFNSKKKETMFCSKECLDKYKYSDNRHLVKCSQCGVEFETNKSKHINNKEVFCSRECYGKWRSANYAGENNQNYNSFTIKCDYCKKEFVIKPSAFKHGQNHFCSVKCKGLYMSKFCIKENSIRWNKNKTDYEREIGRSYYEYTEFTKKVMERDNYTCQVTGKRGTELNCHHLNSYNWDKEHRTDINNAITLSEDIHKLFHKLYRNGNNTKEQFEEFKHRYHNGEFKEVI